jgi:glucose/arabinose dehydrogenase
LAVLPGLAPASVTSGPEASVSAAPTSMPAAPSALTATPISTSRIDLAWTDDSGQATYYKLQRQPYGGSWTTIWLGGRDRSYEDTGLADGKYCYRIRAHNSEGYSSYVLSQPICVTTGAGGDPPDLSGPPPPSTLSATAASAGQINLKWSDASGEATFYKLQRQPYGGSWTPIFVGGKERSYVDGGLADGTYCYRIRAHNQNGFSNYVLSLPNCVKTEADSGSGPPAPSALSVAVASPSRIVVSWTDDSGEATFYKLQRRMPDGSWTPTFLGGKDRTYSDTGLAEGTYCYRIRAHSADGFSDYVASTPTCVSVSGGTDLPPPTAFSAMAVSPSRIDLRWTDDSGEATFYKMQRRPPGGSWTPIFLGGKDRTYSDTGLASGTYCYRIRAHSAEGFSDYVLSAPNCVSTALNNVLATQVVVSGLVQPLFLTAPFGDPRLFIIERAGRIRIVEGGNLLSQPFLDITALVSLNGERGLFSLAFPPDYATTGLFYVYYTDTVGSSVIARYRASGDPDVADPGSAEILLTVPQPYANHNGGTIAFGADGFLYFGMGDGGSGGDPQNRAQDDATLLGKMLRLDVSGGLGSGYAIPSSNPYADRAVPLPEIWAKGFRNPFRFSFDRVFGDLYIGDVGQASREEVDVEPFGGPGGRNYGWRLMEGVDCFNPASNCNDGSLTLPVYDYAHAAGRCSITGGYVYRGSIAEIFGHYFFADFCSGEVFSFVWNGDTGITSFDNRTPELAPAGGFQSIAGFGEDGFGELYIVQFGGGTVFKIVSVPAPPGGSP